MAGIGYSPERLEEMIQSLGGIGPAMESIQSARANEASASPALRALSSEDRAALDRYTTFAQMRQNSSGIATPINYLGGMVNMAATEAFKAAPAIQNVASQAYNAYQGTPDAPNFFGGEDTSPPNLANLAASHYGYTRPSPEAKSAPEQDNGIMAMIRRILAAQGQ
jgi:hypothetical protein